MKLRQLFQWQRMCLLLAGLALFWMACAGEPPNALGLACDGDEMCWGDGVICINGYCRIDAVDSQCPSTCKSSADCRGYTACAGKEKCDKGECVALDPGTCPTFCEKDGDCHTCDKTETFICNFRNECDEAKKSCQTASCQVDTDCTPYQDCGNNPTCNINTGKCVKGSTSGGCQPTCLPTEQCIAGACVPKPTAGSLACDPNAAITTCPNGLKCGAIGTSVARTCTKACTFKDGSCSQLKPNGMKCMPDSHPAPPKPIPGFCLVPCTTGGGTCGKYGLTCCPTPNFQEWYCRRSCN